MKTVGRYVNLGLIFAGCVFLPAGAGYWLDERIGTRTPWFLLGGLALGFVAGLYHVVKTATALEKEEILEKKTEETENRGEEE